MLPIRARPRSAVPALLLALVILPAPPLRADPPPLPAYNADIAQTSISGVSSGAFMAVQFATAWSSVVTGVGAVAGGPFGCSEGSAAAALSTCMQGEPSPDVAALVERTDAWSRSGAIDNTANIARQKVYLFSGYNDTVVARPVSNALHTFYAHYRPQSLFYQTAIGAGHAQITTAYGGGCADNGGAFINRCGYDQAGIILQHVYGALNPRDDATLGGHVIAFSQRDFTTAREPADDSLDEQGFAYVPAACEARLPCRVHMALHGCRQSDADIGEDFVRHAGYNEWADTNRIIVLYPQIQAVGLTRIRHHQPGVLLGLVGLSGCQSDRSPHLAVEVRPADRRPQGDARSDHQRRCRADRVCRADPGSTVNRTGGGRQRHRHRSRMDGGSGRHRLRGVPRGASRPGVSPDRNGRQPELRRCRARAGNRIPLPGTRIERRGDQRPLRRGLAADTTPGSTMPRAWHVRRTVTSRRHARRLAHQIGCLLTDHDGRGIGVA